MWMFCFFPLNCSSALYHPKQLTVSNDALKRFSVGDQTFTSNYETTLAPTIHPHPKNAWECGRSIRRWNPQISRRQAYSSAQERFRCWKARAAVCVCVAMWLCVYRGGMPPEGPMRNRCAAPRLAGWSWIREQAPAWEEFLPGKHPRLAYQISWFNTTCRVCVFTRLSYWL